MLSKEDRKKKNEDFWEGFKKLMRKHMSSTGRRINWLHYPTEAKELYVRLEANSHTCALHFDLQARDAGVMDILWEQMGELKSVLVSEMKEEGIWIEGLEINSIHTCRISWSTDEFNYFKEEDIPKMYEFLKEKCIRFDLFYQEYKEILLSLLD